jgi:FeS assembly protein IscX
MVAVNHLRSVSGTANSATRALPECYCLAQEPQMPKPLTWDDPQDIGILLSETHPEIDPLSVRFTDLHRYVTELPGFTGDPKTSNEGKLEAIQMAWHEEFQDRTQG